MLLTKIKQFYRHIRSRSFIKQVGYLLLFMVIIVYGYLAYQVMYKPWLPTEFIEVEYEVRESEERYFVYRHYAVSNPPYSDSARLKLIQEHMKTDFELGSHSKRVSIVSDYSQEGWQLDFPYFSYVDRTFKPYVETVCFFTCDEVEVTFLSVATSWIARAKQTRSSDEKYKCELGKYITLYPHPLYPRFFNGKKFSEEEVYPSPECLEQAGLSGSDGV